VRGGLENFVEAHDPLNPRLVTIANGLREAPVKLGSDSPDNLYENAPIDGTRTYRVSGSRGTVAYLGIGVQAGSYGAPGGLRTVAYMEASEFETTLPPAGRKAFEYVGGYIEFYVSPTRPAGVTNWLMSCVDPSDGLLLVRQTFLDREAETAAHLKIDLVAFAANGSSALITSESKVPPDLTPERIEAGLRKTALLVGASFFVFVAVVVVDVVD